MKLLLRKCQICTNWYHSYRNHCPACGAARFHIGARISHVDTGHYPLPIELVRGANNYRCVQGVVDNYDAIAIALSED